MTIKSKVPNDKYREEWDRIFKKVDRKTFEYPPIEDNHNKIGSDVDPDIIKWRQDH